MNKIKYIDYMAFPAALLWQCFCDDSAKMISKLWKALDFVSFEASCRIYKFSSIHQMTL